MRLAEHRRRVKKRKYSLWLMVGQIEDLRRLRKKTGRSVAEHIRQAIDWQIRRHDPDTRVGMTTLEREERLDRLERAIAELSRLSHTH